MSMSPNPTTQTATTIVEPTHPSRTTPELVQAYQYAMTSGDGDGYRALVDATTAILIRHRLSLDGGEIATVVEQSRCREGAQWAQECAAYIWRVVQHSLPARDAS